MIYLPDFVQNPSVKPRRQLKVEDAPPAQLADSSPTSATPATALLPKDLAAIHDHAHILYHFVSPHVTTLEPTRQWMDTGKPQITGLEWASAWRVCHVSHCFILCLIISHALQDPELGEVEEEPLDSPQPWGRFMACLGSLRHSWTVVPNRSEMLRSQSWSGQQFVSSDVFQTMPLFALVKAITLQKDPNIRYSFDYINKLYIMTYTLYMITLTIYILYYTCHYCTICMELASLISVVNSMLIADWCSCCDLLRHHFHRAGYT